MNELFNVAKPIWSDHLKRKWNQFLGFRSNLKLTKETDLTIAITAKSYYRLFINGKMYAQGPARTGSDFARVDVFNLTLNGLVKFAIEVTHYQKPDNFSNTLALSEGMLTFEVRSGNKVLLASGRDEITFQELLYRQSDVELMSHSREIIEYYILKPDDLNWIESDKLREYPKLSSTKYTYLHRHAAYPTFNEFEIDDITSIQNTTVPNRREITKVPFRIEQIVQPNWMKIVDDRKKIIDSLLDAQDSLFTGAFSQQENVLKFKNNKTFSFNCEFQQSHVGFLSFNVKVSSPTELNILHSDSNNDFGNPTDNQCVIHYSLAPGDYNLITFEPYLIKTLKFIIESDSTVEISKIGIVEFTYPKTINQHFRCSNKDINDLYYASEKTLRDNTLDIFMDCPERERGGWLCDGYWMSSAQYFINGDTGVEHDFLENILLTEKSEFQNGFFPEVFPGTKTKKGDIGISTWSFWFALNLSEYYQRTLNMKFVLRFKNRITKFVNGILSFKGQSGLLENLPDSFIDWSQSNNCENITPISTGINLLAARVLIVLGKLYSMDNWIKEGTKIQQLLDKPPFMIVPDPIDQVFPDSYSSKDGQLVPNSGITEAGIALELWSGFKTKKTELLNNFIRRMGPDPVEKDNIFVSKSNLFIGLMIRFDILAREKKINILLRELLKVYKPQIQEGPGTLYESINGKGLTGSKDHGFNGYIGSLLIKSVLGIYQIDNFNRIITISIDPSIDNEWANGVVPCVDGEIRVRWEKDNESKKLMIEIAAPNQWKIKIDNSQISSDWTIKVKK